MYILLRLFMCVIVTLTINAQQFNNKFFKSDADIYKSGIFNYSNPISYNALDLNSDGKHSIIISNTSSEDSINIISFLNPVSYQSEWELKDTGYAGELSAFTAAAQITGNDAPEYLIWRSGESRNSFAVYNKLDSLPLFYDAAAENSSYLAPVNLISASANQRDLTSDGLLEFGKLTVSVLEQEIEFVVYNDLTAADTLIFQTESIFSGAVGFTNDLNSDGKPELFFADANKVELYQWDGLNFSIVHVLPEASGMFLTPYNVDADPEAEIIIQTSSNSISVLNSDFEVKHTITIDWELSISSFFVKNINEGAEREIIINAEAGEDNYKTLVYSLTSGESPIWEKDSCYVQSVTDLRSAGYDQLLCSSTGTLSSYLIDGNSGFMKLWEIKDILITPVGPSIPGTFYMNNFFAGFLILNNPDISPADLNSNGLKDIIVTIQDESENYTIAVLNAEGNITDTLLHQSEFASITAQTYDFNNNGVPEILLGENKFFGLGQNRSWIYEYSNISGTYDAAGLPSSFTLDQNYPNPFNPVTNISYELNKGGYTSLRIYDLLGKEAGVIVEEYQPAGRYNVKFDASKLTSGVYIYRLENGGQVSSRKLMLIK